MIITIIFRKKKLTEKNFTFFFFLVYKKIARVVHQIAMAIHSVGNLNELSSITQKKALFLSFFFFASAAAAAAATAETSQQLLSCSILFASHQIYRLESTAALESRL